MSEPPAVPAEDPLATLLAEGLATGRYTCAVAVVGGRSGTDRTAAVGTSDPARDVEADAATRFDVASLTKPVVTTTVTLRLVEDGVLALSDELRDHVPELDGTRRGEATVRQLLTHTAGFEPYHYEGWDTPDATVEAILEAPVLAREPGTAHEYSCLGYVHLGVVLRRATGRSLAELARKLVFEPAGMADARLGPFADPPTNVAVTYDHDHDDRQLKGEIHDPIARAADGESANAGLFATAADLAAFARALLGDGHAGRPSLLAPSTVDALFRDHLPGMDDLHGLGWRLAHDGWPSLGWSQPPDPAPAIGHTGYTGTSLWIDRRHDRFAALLTNAVQEGASGSMARFRERFHAIAAAGRY